MLRLFLLNILSVIPGNSILIYIMSDSLDRYNKEMEYAYLRLFRGAFYSISSGQVPGCKCDRKIKTAGIAVNVNNLSTEI